MFTSSSPFTFLHYSKPYSYKILSKSDTSPVIKVVLYDHCHHKISTQTTLAENILLTMQLRKTSF